MDRTRLLTFGGATPFANSGAVFTPQLNVAGPGTVALDTGNAAFRGRWNVQQGTLRASVAASFGNPTVSGTLTGSTLTLVVPAGGV